MLIKYLTLINLLIIGGSAYEMTGHDACVKVKQTLKSYAECDYRGDQLFFFQNFPNFGNVVKFSKTSERLLKIECFNYRVGVDLERLPKLNFERINNIEFNKCSLSNSSVFSAIKSRFNIRKVEILTIVAMNEPDSVNVTKKLFENLSELEELDMTTSFRINFDEDAFKPLKNLKTLKLLAHDIIALPANVFVPLEKVENLVLSSSGSPKPEAKKFNIKLNKCIYLNTFSLIAVRWPIQIETMVNFVGPTHVSILDNTFDTEISSRAFEKASLIETLHLRNNSIKTLPKNIFAWQKSMNLVDLSFNVIEYLHHSIFKPAEFLEEIDLSHNHFISLSSKLFSSLKHLTRLNLSFNQLKHIDFKLNIGPSDSLEFLDLSHNQIDKVYGNLSCSNLSSLELSHNNLRRFFVDQFWSFSKNNLIITLTKNSLESVDFRDLSYEENETDQQSMTIDIDSEINCNCHTLSLYNFTSRKLKMNPKLYDLITVLPKNIKCNRKSKESPKLVSDIQVESITCPLDFPHQVFCPHRCSCERRPFDNFLIVKCSNISIVPLMPRFKALKDIKLDKIDLNIVANGVSNLPSKRQDQNFNDVTIIHGSHNFIRSISADNIPDRLEILDLKYNRLSHIPYDVIVKFTKLKLLHLSNNPWDCENAIDLVRFVKRYRNIEKDFNMVQCSSYKYFLEIETEDQCKGRFTRFWISIIAVGFALAAFIIYYIKRETITEWIFRNDKNCLLEKTFDLMKLFDGIVCVANNDKVFGKYVAAKLLERPNQYKISMVTKDWPSSDPIPKNILKGFRNSRRLIVILSEYFEESDWSRWNYFNTNTRIIFIVKGKVPTDNIELSNMILIKFGDPWFWERLKNAMTHQKDLSFDEPLKNVEMQPLRKVIVD